MGSIRSSFGISVALGVAAVGWGTMPVLANAEEAPGALEGVIVTAHKRTANLQDVPFSVSASSEAQIRDSGSENIVDLARNIAGLAVAALGPAQSQLAIRGISSGQVVRDQPGVKETE